MTLVSVVLLLAASGSGTLSSVLVGHVKLFQVLVEAIGEQDLAAASLSCLHLHDHLAASHLNLLLLHLLTALLHLLDLLFVARLLSLPLLPLFVGDSSHDLHRLLGLLLLLVQAALFMLSNLLLVGFTLLLLQTSLQPILEGEVAFLLLIDLDEALLLLLSELLLLLQSLSDKLALFPLEHTMGTLLILFVQSGLLQDHLLEKVLLSLKDQHFAQTLLMFLDTQPVIVVDLNFGKSSLVLTVQVKHRLVLSTELRLRVRVLVVSEVHLGLSGLITSVLGINVSLSRLVQTL